MVFQKLFYLYVISLIYIFTQIKATFQQDASIKNEPQDLDEDGEIYTIFPKIHLNPKNYVRKNKQIYDYDCTDERVRSLIYMNSMIKKFHYEFNQNQPKSYYDYKNFVITHKGLPSHYKEEKKLGSGHYAEVFLAKHKKTGQKVAVKILEPIGIHKITREYLILSLLQGHKNIVKLYDTVPLRGTKKQTSNLVYIFKEEDGEAVSLPENVSGKHLKAKALFVFEFIKSPSLSKMEKYMNDFDIRCAIYDVLKALAYMHNKGIFHRDIKPGNIMYNINKKRATVLDFGLAEFFHVSQPYHYKVATRNYKPPEILLNYTCYDHAVDLWATGVTMGQLITRIKPFFSREKDYKVLQAQTQLLGTQGLLNFMKRLNIKVDKYFASQFQKFHKYVGFESLRNQINDEFMTPEAIDLLEKLLQFDPAKRISAQEALEHHYFDPIRDFKEGRNTTAIDFGKQIYSDSESSDIEDNDTESLYEQLQNLGYSKLFNNINQKQQEYEDKIKQYSEELLEQDQQEKSQKNEQEKYDL